jgi:hypothetical protein
MGKCSIAADFLRLLEDYSSGDSNQAGTKMSEGHLISYGIELVVCGLSFDRPELTAEGLTVEGLSFVAAITGFESRMNSSSEAKGLSSRSWFAF